MTYHLCIKIDNKYKPIDIRKIDKFKRKSNLKGNTYSLKDIDTFTSQYESEVSLKTALFSYELISLDDINKEISIRTDEGQKKVMYDLIYKDRKKYLNIEFLEKEIIKNSIEEKFLKEMICKYEKSGICKGIISKISNAMKSNNQNDIEYNLRSFVFYETYDFKTKRLRYDSLHNLAMFVCNYNEREKLSQKGIEKKERYKQVKEDLKKAKEDIMYSRKDEQNNETEYVLDEYGYIIKIDKENIDPNILDRLKYDCANIEKNKTKRR